MANGLILLTVSVAAYFDARWRRVPNELVLVFLAAALAWHGAADGLAGVGRSAAGLLIALVLLFPLFALRGLGAGDVKFFAALSAALTYPRVPAVLFFTTVFSALMAVVLVLRRRLAGRTLRNLGRLAGAWRGGAAELPTIDDADGALVPFTAAAAAATWLVLLGTRPW